MFWPSCSDKLTSIKCLAFTLSSLNLWENDEIIQVWIDYETKVEAKRLCWNYYLSGHAWLKLISVVRSFSGFTVPIWSDEYRLSVAGSLIELGFKIRVCILSQSANHRGLDWKRYPTFWRQIVHFAQHCTRAYTTKYIWVHGLEYAMHITPTRNRKKRHNGCRYVCH